MCVCDRRRNRYREREIRKGRERKQRAGGKKEDRGYRRRSRRGRGEERWGRGVLLGNCVKAAEVEGRGQEAVKGLCAWRKEPVCDGGMFRHVRAAGGSVCIRRILGKGLERRWCLSENTETYACLRSGTRHEDPTKGPGPVGTSYRGLQSPPKLALPAPLLLSCAKAQTWSQKTGSSPARMGDGPLASMSLGLLIHI